MRRLVQMAFVTLTAGVGIGYAAGWLGDGIERYCPFGGLETLWSVLTRNKFTCATGPANLTLMVALLAVTLLARKAFCSWICPFGAVSEWLGLAARKLKWLRRGRHRLAPGLYEPPGRVDRPLRWIRFLVLAVILVATAQTSELVFRPCDPYYILFSANGHDVQWWSYGLLAALLVLAVAIPMAWCRYLCPLGGVLWPLSRAGWLRLRRSEAVCTGCRKCDHVCPYALRVADVSEVVAGDCTLCLDCVAACGKQNALQLTPAGLEWRLHGVAIVVLLAGATAAGLLTAGFVRLASFEREYGIPAPAATRAVTLVVNGVRCVDTAEMAARQLSETTGVVRLVAYAADHRLRVVYDPARTGPAAIREALEAPVFDETTGAITFNVFRVLETQDGSEP